MKNIPDYFAMAEKPTLLVVDDQPANLVAFEALLEDFDIRLLQAQSGEQALQILLHEDVAVVVLDIQMPDMDGYEVADLMQKGSRTRAIPIILVTAINREAEHVMQGYRSGAVDYLTKPVDSLVFRSKVRVFLELDSKNRELEHSRRALKAQLEETRSLKRHNELLLQSIGEGVISLDDHGYIRFANPAAHALVGNTDSLEHTRFSELIAQDSREPLMNELLAQCGQGGRWQDTLEITRGSDETFFAEITVTPMREDGRIIDGVSLVLEDVTRRHHRESRLQQEAETDALTGLLNRRGFDRRLHEQVASGASELALLYIDLDGFKALNDEWGHDTGDTLLRAVAERLVGCIRDSDRAARVGGDEFCILLVAENVENAARIVADKILNAFASPLDITESSVRIGMSIGIARGRTDAPPHALIQEADRAMYTSKRQGGDSVSTADIGIAV